MNNVLVARDGRFSRHLREIFHLESVKRFKAMAFVLEDSSIKHLLDDVRPRAATQEELAWVHTLDHIKRIEKSAGKRLTSFDLDTQATEESYEVARLAVGSVFSMLDDILEGIAPCGFAAVRPPGHHAEANKPMGFCLFNNVALAARYLQRVHGLKRIMIVDIDAHHGNGIQSCFYDTDQVLYFSWHEFPGFPGTGKPGETGCGSGEGFTINVPMGKGSGDREFARIAHFLVEPVASQYKPEMILVSCGFDLYVHDPLVGMRVSPQGYALITGILMRIAAIVCDGRIAFVMEGGYSASGIRKCGLEIMHQMCGAKTINCRDMDKVCRVDPFKLSYLKKVFQIHKDFWEFSR